jgi:predicted oxidoreductase
MKTIPLGSSPIVVSRLAYGCWRIAPTDEAGATTGRAAVLSAVDAGYTFFDHADLYCDGRAEAAFGLVLRETPGLRSRLVIATKCGIRKSGEPSASAPFRYDFSREHIVRSCEGSLRRLGIETIDLYQLHRPDWLCEPQEVAAAFDELRRSGKVREFGVSNFGPSQVMLLQKALPSPLIVNQIEVSLAHLEPFTDGTLDQCLSNHITPLAWSPLGGGSLGDGATQVLPWQERYQTSRTNAVCDKLAASYGGTRTSLALAWLLRHPSGIVPIVGSTNPERIRAAIRADEIQLSREDWYILLEAARGERLP